MAQVTLFGIGAGAGWAEYSLDFSAMTAATLAAGTWTDPNGIDHTIAKTGTVSPTVAIVNGAGLRFTLTRGAYRDAQLIYNVPDIRTYLGGTYEDWKPVYLYGEWDTTVKPTVNDDTINTDLFYNGGEQTLVRTLYNSGQKQEITAIIGGSYTPTRVTDTFANTTVQLARVFPFGGQGRWGNAEPTDKWDPGDSAYEFGATSDAGYRVAAARAYGATAAYVPGSSASGRHWASCSGGTSTFVATLRRMSMRILL